MKNIRKIGSYEVVIYNSDDFRIREIVVNTSLADARKIASEIIEGTSNSFTISRVIDNSKYDKWMVDNGI